MRTVNSFPSPRLRLIRPCFINALTGQRRPGMRAPCVALLAMSVAAGTASAEAPDLTLYDQGGHLLKSTVAADLGYFAQDNSWFGASQENLGVPSGSWWEAALKPGLEGHLATGASGSLYARVSAAGGYTWNGIDAAGSNAELDGVTDWLWEDAYLGWRSGDLSGGSGLSSVDVSAGRRNYQVGSGFLFWDESSDGGDRGAYWVAPRSAADFLGLVRFKSGGFTGDLMYLEADDNPSSDTKVAGVTLDYELDSRGSVGGGVYHIVDSKISTRDGMSIFDLRFDLQPFASLSGLSVEGEYAYEQNGSRQAASGAFLKLGYLFDNVAWSPTLSYRFAYFQGDNPSTSKDEGFDPLFYGFNDWGTWYLGEIIGEYVLSNQNLLVHTLQANASPAAGWNLNLFYYDFRLDDPQGFDSGVTSKHFAREVDLTLDWETTDTLTFSGAGAVAMPGSGARQYTGGSDDWWLLMLLASVRF